MKIKPTTYTQLLISSLQDKPDFKNLARRFWYMLQKNKQYRDLPKILDELEKVYAEKEGFVIAYVESGEELSEKELEEIKEKLSSYRHPEHVSGSQEMPKQVRHDNIIIKSKINPSITGIIAKVEGKVIDLTVEDKIIRLRKQLSNINGQ